MSTDVLLQRLRPPATNKHSNVRKLDKGISHQFKDRPSGSPLLPVTAWAKARVLQQDVAGLKACHNKVGKSVFCFVVKKLLVQD